MSDTLTEQYTEYQLVGEPGKGYPTYVFVAYDPKRIEEIRHIFRMAPSRGWTDYKLSRREVSITRTPWIEVDE